jgi:hypothetical protein
MKRWGVIILLPALMPITHVSTDCLGHKPTEAIIVVSQCEVVVPEADPSLKALDARILDSYRGAILKGRRDRATAQIFVSSNDPKVCAKFKKGVKIHALVNDACCDGDPNPPCHLGFSAYIEKLLP